MSEQSTTERGPISQLLHSVSQVLCTILTMAQTRLALFSSELQDEVRHAAQLLMWGFIALFAAGMSLFLAALVVIFVFWDTHRVLAASSVTALFVIIAVTAGWIIKRKLANKPRMLHATLSELSEDSARLRRHMEER